MRSFPPYMLLKDGVSMIRVTGEGVPVGPCPANGVRSVIPTKEDS